MRTLFTATRRLLESVPRLISTGNRHYSLVSTNARNVSYIAGYAFTRLSIGFPHTQVAMGSIKTEKGASSTSEMDLFQKPTSIVLTLSASKLVMLVMDWTWWVTAHP